MDIEITGNSWTQITDGSKDYNLQIVGGIGAEYLDSPAQPSDSEVGPHVLHGSTIRVTSPSKLWMRAIERTDGVRVAKVAYTETATEG